MQRSIMYLCLTIPAKSHNHDNVGIRVFFFLILFAEISHDFLFMENLGTKKCGFSPFSCSLAFSVIWSEVSGAIHG